MHSATVTGLRRLSQRQAPSAEPHLIVAPGNDIDAIGAERNAANAVFVASERADARASGLQRYNGHGYAVLLFKKQLTMLL